MKLPTYQLFYLLTQGLSREAELRWWINLSINTLNGLYMAEEPILWI